MSEIRLAVEEKMLPESLREYATSAEMQRKLYKKTMIIVIASQIFGGGTWCSWSCSCSYLE